MKIVLPGEIKILNVAIKGKSRTDLNLPEPGREGQIIVIKPFSLPVNQWFNVRLTFDCQGIEFLKKLEKIDIKAEKEDVDDKKDVGDSDSLKINFLKYIDWEEKFEKRAKRRNISLAVVLAILSFISICLFINVWVFSSSNSLSLLPYQLLVTFGISVIYSCLIVLILLNCPTVTPST